MIDGSITGVHSKITSSEQPSFLVYIPICCLVDLRIRLTTAHYMGMRFGPFFPIRDNHDFSIVVERNPHQYRCMSLSQNLDFGGEKKRGDFTIILTVDGSIPLFERSNA